ncbi:hypothetical protein [Mycobacterium parmense]|uniref:Uncharacterized protein n=1 Tax=Mycobacterium parmense TaxID=185642 RepID=A0A7I7YSZ3_9MYCO|nr:hypothetical protein [Mycobacterium parmense]MCV7351706.1 hypothetical protein [Mycobacterium parmense]BBZ44829.1 hypothetical protein MPRM_21100 [Mycobacterium parmense]
MVIAAFLVAAFPAPPAAHAGPIQWCDPASSLFDPTICYSDSHERGGKSRDPFGPVYDPDYCAAKGG